MSHATPNPPADLSEPGPLTLHREDDPATPGRQVFTLRDESGTEVARTAAFLPDEAPARNALDRLRETLLGRGWEIVQRPNAAFGDPWWGYRFAPGPTAGPLDPASLAEAITSPGIPRLGFGRRRTPRVRQRRQRQRRSVKLPSASVLVFAFFSLFMLTVTIGFILVVLLVLSS
jgi:hypothetical protein